MKNHFHLEELVGGFLVFLGHRAGGGASERPRGGEDNKAGENTKSGI